MAETLKDQIACLRTAFASARRGDYAPAAADGLLNPGVEELPAGDRLLTYNLALIETMNAAVGVCHRQIRTGTNFIGRTAAFAAAGAAPADFWVREAHADGLQIARLLTRSVTGLQFSANALQTLGDGLPAASSLRTLMRPLAIDQVKARGAHTHLCEAFQRTVGQILPVLRAGLKQTRAAPVAAEAEEACDLALSMRKSQTDLCVEDVEKTIERALLYLHAMHFLALDLIPQRSRDSQWTARWRGHADTYAANALQSLDAADAVLDTDAVRHAGFARRLEAVRPSAPPGPSLPARPGSAHAPPQAFM